MDEGDKASLRKAKYKRKIEEGNMDGECLVKQGEIYD